MPIYDFKCNCCGKVEEEYVPSLEAETPKCKCGQKCEMTRINSFSNNKPILKGSGFYETDYKNK
jgi:putative FmdB family regulatory protein